MSNQTIIHPKCERLCSCGKPCDAKAPNWSAHLRIWVCDAHSEPHLATKDSSARTRNSPEKIPEALAGLDTWLKQLEKYRKLTCRCN
jgi:hypothetical protein